MIYLDNAATTEVLPEVVEAMEQVMRRDFGNPSSRHAAGLAAERHLRGARETVARRVGAAPERVLFTSGGTEANALALLGTCRRARKRHLVVSAVEHPSVLGCAGLLEREGFEVTRAPVTAGGWVDPGQIAALVRPDTALVALMHTNNETGIVQPTAEVASAARRRAPECQVMVDAVQSLTALSFTLDALGADLLTLSSHKVHGPKGSGCLALGPRAGVAPLWGGGDQEAQLRPGTENLPGIVGFARALELSQPDPDRLAALSARLERAVLRVRPEAYPVGDPARRAPHLLAMAVPGVATEVLVNLLESLGVCASSGAACHSRRTLRSHVAAAMGLPADHGTVRFSLSTTTAEDEVSRAAELVEQAFGQL